MRNLDPLEGVIMLFHDSTKVKRFGRILSIVDANQVSVQYTLNRQVVIKDLHKRTLVLLYRPSEWDKDIPLPVGEEAGDEE